MSLYYEAAEILTASGSAGGSLKSRIFSRKDLKSQPAQIYALAIETCKWSSVLKEVIEHTDILRLERKISPVLSLLLIHDLLLAKRGIALPATHGLRVAIERHRGRLQAELTKARIRRKLSSLEALKMHVESGLENVADEAEKPYPRWVRINSLKTTLEEQLETTFGDLERQETVDGVRRKGEKGVYVDVNIPNLVAVSPTVDLTKSEAYKSGKIIFQDKASCFPAYLLDPSSQDGDFIDACSAPGNKTTHLAAILLHQNPDCKQTIHAFEKNTARSSALEKMVNLAGSHPWTKLHAPRDFLKSDPQAPEFKNVGALLLDPSCSGSGIVGRDEMPTLYLPEQKQQASSKVNHTTSKKGPQKPSGPPPNNLPSDQRKRKREAPTADDDLNDILIDDDGVVTALNSTTELTTRLSALSSFQLELLLHAFAFPAARKITYSTCSIHEEENENVVKRALESKVARTRGWRLLGREEQVSGLREWCVRGVGEGMEGCVRARKGDGFATMGFFLAGFVRDGNEQDIQSLSPEPAEEGLETQAVDATAQAVDQEEEDEEEEWTGFADSLDPPITTTSTTEIPPPILHKKSKTTTNNKKPHNHNGIKTKNRPGLIPQNKKRKKGTGRG